METKPADCPCASAVPYSDTYDLERQAGRTDRHPGFAEMVVDDLVITCRRCGARWEGTPLPGGGIYGDTFWRKEVR